MPDDEEEERILAEKMQKAAEELERQREAEGYGK